MRTRFLRMAAPILIAALLLASCAPGQDKATASELSARILLWHTWQGTGAAALDEIIAKFREINPNVVVKKQAFATRDDLLAQFQAAADSGLGPDLLLGPNSWIRPLANSGLIADIEDQVDETVVTRFMPSALTAVRNDGGLYGLPESLDTMVLYYNRRLTDAPPTTVDELLEQAAAGRIVTMSSSFYDAFWGVQAFGGRLFDDDGRVILDKGGYANWLAWLKDARDAPGMILDTNREVLRTRFIQDRVAYYIGNAGELELLLEALGASALGVGLLPAGPVGSAGPFLDVEALLFSTVSSASQREAAIGLASFITNVEQSATLMRKAYHVPANATLRINPRLNPTINSIATQARTAVPVPNIPQMDAVWGLATDAYTKALEGVLEPAQAAVETTRAINEANDYPLSMPAATVCTGVGTLRLANLWQQEMADAMDTLLTQFAAACPTIIVSQERLTPNELMQMMEAAPQALGRLDLLTGPHRLVAQLVAANQIQNIAGLIDAETQQRYRPIAVDAFRYSGGIYGLPLFTDVDALYYNRALVTEPARTLTDLRTQAANGTPVALEIGFEQAYWGIGAFGGQLIDAESNLLPDQGGFEQWLTWLQEAQDTTNLQLTSDVVAALTLFSDGRSAYFMGGLDRLETLRKIVGEQQLGVALLPAGPAGAATPLIDVTGFMFNQAATESTTQLALQFVNYVTDAEQQATLADLIPRSPAIVSTEASSDPLRNLFVEQARAGILAPSLPEWAAIVAAGDAAYAAVLDNAVPPEEAIATMVAAVDAAANAESE